jgi:hypothetical protein
MVNSAGSVRSFTIETNDIDINGGRVRRGLVTTQLEVNSVDYSARDSLYIGWKFDGIIHATTDETSTIAGGWSTDYDISRFTDYEACPNRQKCNQVRVRLVFTPFTGAEESRWNCIGIALEVISTGKKIKNSLGSARG